MVTDKPIFDPKLLKNKFVSFKVHTTFEGIIKAFADPDLIGQTFRDSIRNIKLVITPKFYQGELIAMNEALEMLRSYPNCNIVGSLAYYAVKAGLAHKDALLWIIDKEKKKRIPHLILVNTKR
jgi:hypothetical protein